MIAYVDGDWTDEAGATIPIDDRGFLIGDGVYDTCRLFEGAWFRFDDHAERLRASGDVLRIAVPPVAELRRIADELLDRNRGAAADAGAAPPQHAGLRITVTRGSGGSGLATAGAGPARVVATLRPMADDWRERARRGWSVSTARTRHPPASVLPPQLKGQGRVFSLLAKLDAEAEGCDEPLLLSLDGHITEGATWNVFWRRGERLLRTPSPEAGVLAGVTRSLVIDTARAAGYQVEEGVWPRSELDEAEEAFATMTSLGIVPLNSLDGRAFPGTGVAVDRLVEAFWHRVREETHG